MKTHTPGKLESVFHECFDTVRTKHFDAVSEEGEIRLLFVLCPLFEFGKLEHSHLLQNVYSIDDSRVGIKWRATEKLLEHLTKELELTGVSVGATFVFANRGVLLDGNPKNADRIALEKHLLIWKTLVRKAELKFNLDSCLVTDFESLDVPMPQFIDPSAPMKNIKENDKLSGLNQETFINEVNESLDEWFGISNFAPRPNNDILNKRSKRALTRLSKSIGNKASFWLISTYIAFDWMIPQLINRGINVSIERFDPLHGIVSFTEEAEKVARAEITV